MQKLADILKPIAEEDLTTCDRCKDRFTTVLILGQESLCHGCYAEAMHGTSRALEAEGMIANLDQHTNDVLSLAGLSTRERTASYGKIPVAIKHALRTAGEVELFQGTVPRYGFGLTGTAGTGKTFTLAALMRGYVSGFIRAQAPRIGYLALKSTGLRWLPWPEAVNRMRTASLADGGHAEVARWVAAWTIAKVLVLDDLGAERARGSYADDWATSQLDSIIDGRHRECLPTWYTTNLTERELGERYGARFYSRLIHDNPLLAVPRANDMRART